MTANACPKTVSVFLQYESWVSARSMHPAKRTAVPPAMASLGTTLTVTNTLTNVLPGIIVFNATTNYMINGSGKISGGTSLFIATGAS